MVEAYCGHCDEVTTQSVVNVLFGATPLGNCLSCGSANPLFERLSLVLDVVLGDELREYQEKRAAFLERTRA